MPCLSNTPHPSDKCGLWPLVTPKIPEAQGEVRSPKGLESTLPAPALAVPHTVINSDFRNTPLWTIPGFLGAGRAWGSKYITPFQGQQWGFPKGSGRQDQALFPGAGLRNELTSGQKFRIFFFNSEAPRIVIFMLISFFLIITPSS